MYYQRIDIEDFKYRLYTAEVFETGYDLGEWELINPAGQLVAKCKGSRVTILPGYLWDGSTVIGSVYEDDVTLEASLLHDVLYNVRKNPDNILVPFSLYTADKIFRNCLRAKYRGFFRKWLFPNLYLAGLWTLGLPWKLGHNDYYHLKKKSGN